MNYEQIMCKFCKECIGLKLKKTIIETKNEVNSDTIVTRCENYYSKQDFESDIV